MSAAGAARFAGSKFAFWRDTGDDCVYDHLQLAAAVRTYAKTPLRGPPGTGFLYSNAGINVAVRATSTAEVTQ
eukprot:SAG22_NODE_9972_length_560_cov_1.496746_2_plen_72_part_01